MPQSIYDGRKVLIMPTHPHAGATGVVVGLETTITGRTGLVVELDNNEGRCCVFDINDIKLI